MLTLKLLFLVYIVGACLATFVFVVAVADVYCTWKALYPDVRAGKMSRIQCIVLIYKVLFCVLCPIFHWVFWWILTMQYQEMKQYVIEKLEEQYADQISTVNEELNETR